MYFTVCETPIVGTLTLASDGDALVGCWFDNDRHFGYGTAGAAAGSAQESAFDLPVFVQTRAWLDRYFAGERPDPRELTFARNLTPFQLAVREAMLDIPYGQTRTYGDIAKELEAATGRRQSPRAVGGAVGKNPLCVIVPCHRVMGAGGNLTGFGGGLDTKIALLEHEGVATAAFRRPAHGTAIVGIDGAGSAFFGKAGR